LSELVNLLPSMVRNLSIVDPPFLVGLGLATAVIVTASWFRLHPVWLRWGIRALGATLPIVLAAAAVNARYAYLPTVAALLGRNAAQQVSPSQLRALELAPVEPAHMGRSKVRLAVAGRAHEHRSRLTHGVVVPFTIPGTRSGFHARTAEVYLPPAYFAWPRPALPVIELLHGTPGSPADWTRGGFADVTADAYASLHHGRAPILVMPDVNGSWIADSECVDGRAGRAQTYLTDDVRRAVIARFHTRRDADGWAIAGLSEGGYCAIQIGLRHPDLYGAIGDYSGGEGPSVAGGIRQLFSGSVQDAEQDAARYDPMAILKGWHGSLRPVIWFEVGKDDSTVRNVAELDVLARIDGFQTRLVVQPSGDHSFDSWRRAFRDSLPWIAQTFGSSLVTDPDSRA